MLVILARHGNTFAPGEPAVWVGGRTDLPLVEKGRAQAEAIGDALREAGLLPVRTIAGPLKRTRETAAIALAAAGLDPDAVEIDERLREVDYGRWEAKSSDEIRAMGDGALLAAWEDHGEWPAAAGWPGSRDRLVGDVSAALRDVCAGSGEGPALVVSSNGVFRLIASQLAPSLASTKVATGAVSLLLHRGNEAAKVLCWNVPPRDLRSYVERGE